MFVFLFDFSPENKKFRSRNEISKFIQETGLPNKVEEFEFNAAKLVETGVLSLENVHSVKRAKPLTKPKGGGGITKASLKAMKKKDLFKNAKLAAGKMKKGGNSESTAQPLQKLVIKMPFGASLSKARFTKKESSQICSYFAPPGEELQPGADVYNFDMDIPDSSPQPPLHPKQSPKKVKGKGKGKASNITNKRKLSVGSKKEETASPVTVETMAVASPPLKKKRGQQKKSLRNNIVTIEGISTSPTATEAPEILLSKTREKDLSRVEAETPVFGRKKKKSGRSPARSKESKVEAPVVEETTEPSEISTSENQPASPVQAKKRGRPSNASKLKKSPIVSVTDNHQEAISNDTLSMLHSDELDASTEDTSIVIPSPEKKGRGSRSSTQAETSVLSSTMDDTDTSFVSAVESQAASPEISDNTEDRLAMPNIDEIAMVSGVEDTDASFQSANDSHMASPDTVPSPPKKKGRPPKSKKGGAKSRPKQSIAEDKKEEMTWDEYQKQLVSDDEKKTDQTPVKLEDEQVTEVSSENIPPYSEKVVEPDLTSEEILADAREYNKVPEEITADYILNNGKCD